ncbi:hypothetical protein H0H93_009527 [Arthromyces matolae]|nr:hypothetical protein H0H93_009527 [Arthromyces matolae]
MDEPSFKQIKLSLERPYKDDDGSLIPILFDITPEGQQIFDKKESPTKTLGDNLRRIFIERGSDFFDKTRGRDLEEQPLIEDGNISDASEPLDSSDQMSTETRTMNVDELMKMRADIFPQLFTSLGEITLARDLLSSLLSSSQIQPLESTNLSATIVTKSPPIVSVQAFNAQLTIGSKDEALRKAANVFMSAAQSMDRGRIKGEKYWVDALKVRRANWGLNPAPLPFGAPTGKGADKTSKDFLISYGLEESPAILRRQAVARMITNETSTHGLVFLHRQNTRLRVSLSVIGEDGKRTVSENTLISAHEENPEGALKGAQQEVVEQEIFSLLVREAGNLPTASARVSERLIAIDAAHNTELRFEMVEKEFLSDDSIRGEECNLIYFALHALLLRRHGYLQTQRLGAKGSNISTKDNTFSPPPILQPVIDLLQYQVFCARVKAEVDKMIIALSAAGIQTTLRFNVVGETGCQLLQVLEDNRGSAKQEKRPPSALVELGLLI